ncbi:MAG: hypothetical protein R3300_09430 [Candidatus Promineifilaceae bacterium]|nr:hypothetical protein [Candidatus Promineifilaceae bacterium]
MRPRTLTWLLGLLLAAVVVAGCSLVAGDDEGDASSGESNTGPETNTGTIIIDQRTVPAGQAGSFTYTGVPSGTISADSTLVVADLEPGTYTTTEVDPAPDFDVTAVECDDQASASPSSGDAGSRTAVINLEAGETVRCTYTNTQRGSLVIASQTVPDAVGGSFQFTGSPTGTIPANGTLVVANLEPGTYTSTERDPAPEFDVTAVECDDQASATPSSGDAGSRTAVFNLDPGEMVTCTFTNTRRGTLVVASETVPDGAAGDFLFTGVPSGTVSANGTLVAANLTPGTYTTTESDPAPEFELTAVECDDEASASPSSGDASTRTAVFNLDPGETVRCLFTNAQPGATVTPTITAGGATAGGPGTGQDGGSDGDGINPFVDPDADFNNFPEPSDLPPDAGTFAAPKPGPWTVTHYGGQLDCGVMTLAIPASPPESGVLEVLDGGQTVVGTGLEDAQGVSITMNASPAITGRYTGSFQATEQGVPITIDYFWQVVTDEHIVGFLTSSFTSEGVTCSIYRSFEMFYSG